MSLWRERMGEEKFRLSVLNVPTQKTTVQMENLQNIKFYNPRSPNFNYSLDSLSRLRSTPGEVECVFHESTERL